MKRILPILSLVTVSVVALAGCANSPVPFKPARLSRVNLGMSKEDVARVLGRPMLAATAADGLEVFRYSEPVRGRQATNYYGVVFKGGEVIDYGPEAGMRLGGQLAVQELFGNFWMQIQPSQP
jgi:hypothetical protein